MKRAWLNFHRWLRDPGLWDDRRRKAIVLREYRACRDRGRDRADHGLWFNFNDGMARDYRDLFPLNRITLHP